MNVSRIGAALAIRLVNRNQPDVPGVTRIEVDFDDVTLDASPAPPAPVLPLALGAIVAGLAVAGARRVIPCQCRTGSTNRVASCVPRP